MNGIRESHVQNLRKSQPEAEFQRRVEQGRDLLKGCRSAGIAWGPLFRSPGQGDQIRKKQKEQSFPHEQLWAGGIAALGGITGGARKRRKLPESNQGQPSRSEQRQGRPRSWFTQAFTRVLSVCVCAHQAQPEAMDAAVTGVGKTLLPQAFPRSKGGTRGKRRQPNSRLNVVTGRRPWSRGGGGEVDADGFLEEVCMF